MKGNVVQLESRTSAAAADQAEPLDAAVLEVSARIASNGDERRLLFLRLDELRGSTPSLRRRRARVLPFDLTRPVTFFSIEDADSQTEPGPLQAA